MDGSPTRRADTRFADGAAEVRAIVRSFKPPPAGRSAETEADPRLLQALRDQLEALQRLPAVVADPADFLALCIDLSYSLLRRGLYAAVLDPCCAAYARALEAAERRAPAPRSPGGSPPGSPPRRDDEAGRQQRLLRQVQMALVAGTAQFQLGLARDPALAHPATAVGCLRCLQGMQRAAAPAAEFPEQLYFLTYSATVYIYRGCVPLIAAQYYAECALLIGWCILALESNLVLLAAKWVPWRARLYGALCLCYEGMGRFEEAAEVAHRLAGKLAFLLEVENSDVVPPPPETLETLHAAAEVAKRLQFKYDFLREPPREIAKPKDAPPKTASGKAASSPNAALVQQLQAAFGTLPLAVRGGLDTLTLDPLRVLRRNTKLLQPEVVAKMQSLVDALEDALGSVVAQFKQKHGLAMEERDHAFLREKTRERKPAGKGREPTEPADLPACSLEEALPAAEHLRLLNLLYLYDRWDAFERWLVLLYKRLDLRRGGQPDPAGPALDTTGSATFPTAGAVGAADPEDPAGTVLVRAGDEGPLGMALLEGELDLITACLRMENGGKDEMARLAQALLAGLQQAGGAVRQRRPDLFEDGALQLYAKGRDAGGEFPVEVLEAIVTTLVEIQHGNPLLIANLSDQLVQALEGQGRVGDAVPVAAQALAVVAAARRRIVRNARDDVQTADLDGCTVSASPALYYQTLYAVQTKLQADFLRLRLKLGVQATHGKLLRRKEREVAKSDKREAEQYLFGGLSKKEQRATQLLREAEVPVPVTSGEENALAEECQASQPLTCLLKVELCDFRTHPAEQRTLLTQAVACAEAASQDEAQCRARCGRPPGSPVATVDSLPSRLLWARLALQAAAKGCSDLARRAAQQALQDFVVPATDQHTNPVAMDTLDVAVVEGTCTPTLQALARVLLATAALPTGAGEPKEELDGIPTEVYQTWTRQRSALRSANCLLLALHLAHYIGDPSLVLRASNALCNALLTVLAHPQKPLWALRPLSLIAALLPTLPPHYFGHPALQYLAGRTAFDLLHLARQLALPPLTAALTRRFQRLLLCVAEHPTPFLARAAAAAHARLQRGGDVEAVPEEPKGKAEKDGKAKEKERERPRAAAAPPEVGLRALLPLEWVALWQWALLRLPQAAPLLAEGLDAAPPEVAAALRHPLWLAIAPLVPVREAAKAADDLAAHKAHPFYPTLACEVATALAATQLFDRADRLVEDARQALRDRLQPSWQRERELVAQALTSDLEDDLGKSKKSEAKKGKPAKDKAGKDKKGPEAPPETAPVPRGVRRAFAKAFALRLHLAGRQVRAELLRYDVPHRAQLSLLAAALRVQQVTARLPPGAPLRIAAVDKPSSPAAGSPKKDPKAKAKAPPPASPRPQALEDLWPERRSAVHQLQQAVELFRRAGRYRYMYNACLFLYSTCQLFFGPLAGDPHLPGSAPRELLATLAAAAPAGLALPTLSTDPLLPPNAGAVLARTLTSLADAEPPEPPDPLAVDRNAAQCWKAFVVAVTGLLEVLEQVSAGLDLREDVGVLAAGPLLTALRVRLGPQGVWLAEEEQRLAERLRAAHAEMVDPPATADLPPPGRTPHTQPLAATTKATVRGRSAAAVEAADDELPWEDQLSDVKLPQLVTMARYFLYALEVGQKSGWVVHLGTELNARTAHRFAEQLLPLVLRHQRRLGHDATAHLRLMQEVIRDKPKALEGVCAARLSWRLLAARAKAGLAAPESAKGSISGPRTTAGGAERHAYREAVAAFQSSIAFLRSKANHTLTIQQLALLGQLLCDNGNVKDATTAWHDAVDVMFGTVHACRAWRALTDREPLALLQSLGAWRLLMGVLVLSRLGRCIPGDAGVERCLFAATLARALLLGSALHPATYLELGTYQPAFLVADLDLFGDGACDGVALLQGLQFVIWTLVGAASPLHALPCAAVAHHLAFHVVRDPRTTTQLKVLTCQALVQAGHLEGAFHCLMEVMLGKGLPNVALQGVPVTLESIEAEAAKPSDKGRKAESKPDKKKAPSTLTTPTEGLRFLNHLPVDSAENRAAIDRLTSMGLGMELRELYGPAIVQNLQFAIVEFLVAVAQADGPRALAARAPQRHVTSAGASRSAPKAPPADDRTATLALNSAEAIMVSCRDRHTQLWESIDVRVRCSVRYYLALIHAAQGLWAVAVKEMQDLMGMWRTSHRMQAPERYTVSVPSYLTCISAPDVLRWYRLLAAVLWEQRRWDACRGACEQALDVCAAQGFELARWPFELTLLRLRCQLGAAAGLADAFAVLVAQCQKGHRLALGLPTVLATAAAVLQETSSLAAPSDEETLQHLSQGPLQPIEPYLTDALHGYVDLLQHCGVDLTLGDEWTALYQRHNPFAAEYIAAACQLAQLLLLRHEDAAAQAVVEAALRADEQCGAPSPQGGILARFLLGRIQRRALVTAGLAMEASWGRPSTDARDSDRKASLCLPAATLLEASLALNVTQGIHDYDLARAALLDLAFLHGAQLTPGQATAHRWVAVQCLVTAARVQQMHLDLVTHASALKESPLDKWDELPDCVLADLRDFRRRENAAQLQYLGAQGTDTGTARAGRSAVADLAGDGPPSVRLAGQYYARLLQEHRYGAGYDRLREWKLIRLRQHLQRCPLERELFLAQAPSLLAMPALPAGLVVTQATVLDGVAPARPPAARPKKGSPPERQPPPCVAFFYVLCLQAPEVPEAAKPQRGSKKVPAKGEADLADPSSAETAPALPRLGLLFLEQPTLRAAHGHLRRLRQRYALEALRLEEQATLASQAAGATAGKGKAPAVDRDRADPRRGAPAAPAASPAVAALAEEHQQPPVSLDTLRGRVILSLLQLLRRWQPPPTPPPHHGKDASTGAESNVNLDTLPPEVRPFLPAFPLEAAHAEVLERMFAADGGVAAVQPALCEWLARLLPPDAHP